LSPTIKWPEFGSDHNPHGIAEATIFVVFLGLQGDARELNPSFLSTTRAARRKFFAGLLVLLVVSFQQLFGRFLSVDPTLCWFTGTSVGFHERTRSQVLCGVGKSCTHLDGKEGECACYSYDYAYEQEPCDGEDPILKIAGYAATSGYSRRRLSARRSARYASRSATLSVACFVYVYRHSLGTCP